MKSGKANEVPPVKTSVEIAGSSHEQMPKGIRGACGIRQAALVQHGHESFPGFGKDVWQAASFGDPAGAAIDEAIVAFSMPNNLTNSDVRSRSGQRQSTVTSPGGLDEASSTQVLNDLHQVVLCDAVGFRDLPDRHSPTVMAGEVDERTKRVVGVAGQFHLFTLDAFQLHV